MSDLIDTSVFSGYWPFRAVRYRTSSALKDHLQANGVSQAWVAATEAILYPDPMEANEPLFRDIKDDDFYIPVAIINPTLASWREDALACLEEWGCRAIKLLPNYHRYEMTDARVDEVVGLAIDRNVPLCFQLFMMDLRAQHPLLLVQGVDAGSVARVALRHPEVRILATGAMSGAAGALSKAPNTWMEISLAESDQALKGVVDKLGPDRVVFGSHSPFQYFKAVKAKLCTAAEDVAPEVIEVIKARNARELLTGKTTV